jgi:hypothetical protein
MENQRACRICGQLNCKKHSFSFQNIRRIDQFTGSSPPEIFIGRYNYPNVNVGILSPNELGNTEILSSQELWHKNKFSIPQILALRSQLILGRKQSNIKNTLKNNKTRFLSTLQEVAMTSRSIATEFKLTQGIKLHHEKDTFIPSISRAAHVESVRLEENTIIDKKIDYLTGDTDAKSQTALIELGKANIPTSTIIKILSAGLLGLGSNRKLVPTRWAITAVDDTLSKEKLKKIKYNPEISEILLFTAEYIGNHYEFLLLPDKFSFEVIEINKNNSETSWQDYETFFGRKDYASSVTGAYYANRLALSEYLEKAQKQAACIIFREINEEYTSSMGVGVLRQISRDALSNQPEKFSTLKEALDRIQSRIKLPLLAFTNKSILLKDYGKQQKLNNWFK